MKEIQLLSWILILISVFSCRNENSYDDIQQLWLVQKIESKSNSFRIPTDMGILFDISKDSILGINLFTEKVSRREYSIINDFLTSGGEKQGEITHLSKEKLIIFDSKDSSRIQSVPINPQKIPNSSRQKIYNILTSKEWELNADPVSYQFTFDTSMWRMNSNGNNLIKNLKVKYLSGKKSSSFRFEFWTLREYNDDYIVSFSKDEFDCAYIHLKSVEDDQMTCKFLDFDSDKWSQTELKKISNSNEIGNFK